IDIKTILIPKNWRKYVNTGKREEGYLGYGYAKFAFMGRVASDSFAVLQSKNLNSDTEYLNKYDLKCELKLLARGKFFLDSFIRRAQQYGAKNIPEMKWNADGAFLGTLVDKLPDLPAEQRSNQSLIWNVFLAVPLLEPGATECKFSGNGDTGENSDYLGIWIDAFAHHTVVDSMGEYVFVDIQGKFDGSSGFWDKGWSGILQFLKEHKCNKICRKLGLNTEVVVVPAPLNDIAVPQMEVLPTIKPRNLHRQWEL
ncbi:kinase-like domain-containing protein, partial [Gautieria morchelliformis]